MDSQQKKDAAQVAAEDRLRRSSISPTASISKPLSNLIDLTNAPKPVCFTKMPTNFQYPLTPMPKKSPAATQFSESLTHFESSPPRGRKIPRLETHFPLPSCSPFVSRASSSSRRTPFNGGETSAWSSSCDSDGFRQQWHAPRGLDSTLRANPSFTSVQCSTPYPGRTQRDRDTEPPLADEYPSDYNVLEEEYLTYDDKPIIYADRGEDYEHEEHLNERGMEHLPYDSQPIIHDDDSEHEQGHGHEHECDDEHDPHDPEPEPQRPADDDDEALAYEGETEFIKVFLTFCRVAKTQRAQRKASRAKRRKGVDGYDGDDELSGSEGLGGGDESSDGSDESDL